MASDLEVAKAFHVMYASCRGEFGQRELFSTPSWWSGSSITPVTSLNLNLKVHV